jgi:hypothetical protein
LFEIAETFGVTMAYVKDEGNNLSTMTNALTFVVFCKLLWLTTPFIGSCWGHAMCLL